MANKGRSLIAVIVVAARGARFAALLATGRIAAHPSSPLSADPTITPYATPPYPTPPPLLPPPTLPPSTPVASCPQDTQMQAGAIPGGGFPVKFPAPSLGITIDVLPLSGGTGITTQGFFYQLDSGKILYPTNYTNYGYVVVTVSPVDPCAYDTLRRTHQPLPPTPQRGGTYITSSAIGGILFNGVSGDVATFTTTKGVTGSFNYVTGQFCRERVTPGISLPCLSFARQGAVRESHAPCLGIIFIEACRPHAPRARGCGARR